MSKTKFAKKEDILLNFFFLPFICLITDELEFMTALWHGNK